jgi:uncharacterized protein (DUF58 family)
VIPAQPTRHGSSTTRRAPVAEPLRECAEELASRLPPLLIAAERVAVTVAQGVHGRRRVGQGDTFWQFRQYQPGDAAAAIDWRKSAKSQRLYVRESEWEAAQSVWLWRDASGSMDYSSAGYLPGAQWPKKRERAELLLVALASLLVRGGERLSLLGSGLAPMHGRLALSRLVELIDKDRPGTTSLPAFEALPRAAQLVLFGDFLSPLESVHAALSRFAASELAGHLMQIVDPAEEDLPFDGRVRFADIEERDEIVISRVESIRGDYGLRFRRHREGLAAIAANFGWTFATHRTDRPPELALLALFGALSQGRAPMRAAHRG